VPTPLGHGLVHARERQTRLPLLVGHSVQGVAERADGMLEVQAERAGCYAANVIFASIDSLVMPAAARPAGALRTPKSHQAA
jgi:hypothetical protein